MPETTEATPPRPPRLTFDQIAAKYNLPADEIQRRRILAKLKQRVKGLADRKHDLLKEEGMISAIGVVSMKAEFRNRIRDYAISGSDRAKYKLRRKARCSYLAYGFFKNRPYLAIEKACKVPPDWGRVQALIQGQMPPNQYGTVLQRLTEWKNAGQPPS